MKLQLKNVHFSERLSQETNAFAADVYFEGKKFATAENDGHGGQTLVRPLSNKLDVFKEANEYVKELPEIVYDSSFREGTMFSMPSTLENQVDELFLEWVEKKELKKQSNKGIFYQKPDGGRMIMTFKGFTMSKLLKNPSGRAHIRRNIDKLESEGNTILNTNLGVLNA